MNYENEKRELRERAEELKIMRDENSDNVDEIIVIDYEIEKLRNEYKKILEMEKQKLDISITPKPQNTTPKTP